MIRFVFAVVLALGFVACGRADDAKKADPLAPKARVEQRFAAMRDGTWKQGGPDGVGWEFPACGWDEVPALLERAASEEPLAAFPVNPISSYAQRECSEGMAALWMIEGVRKGGKRFPSLNPLCLAEGETAENWEAASAKNQPRVLEAYRAWWKEAQSLPPEKAAEVDPLRGAKLHWH